jgi:hypothetical protein
VIEGLKAWSHESFHLQHYTSMHALVHIELYTGDAEVAWRHIEGQWKALEHSILLRTQILRIAAMHLRARAAIASAVAENEPGRLAVAEKMAQKIAREKMAWALPWVTLLKAAITHQRGDARKTIDQLKVAIDGFERQDMGLYAAAARRRLGELTDGELGRQLIAEADAWMSKQKIQNPARMVNMLAPGFTERQLQN